MLSISLLECLKHHYEIELKLKNKSLSNQKNINFYHFLNDFKLLLEHEKDICIKFWECYKPIKKPPTNLWNIVLPIFFKDCETPLISPKNSIYLTLLIQASCQNNAFIFNAISQEKEAIFKRVLRIDQKNRLTYACKVVFYACSWNIHTNLKALLKLLSHSGNLTEYSILRRASNLTSDGIEFVAIVKHLAFLDLSLSNTLYEEATSEAKKHKLSPAICWFFLYAIRMNRERISLLTSALPLLHLVAKEFCHEQNSAIHILNRIECEADEKEIILKEIVSLSKQYQFKFSPKCLLLPFTKKIYRGKIAPILALYRTTAPLLALIPVWKEAYEMMRNVYAFTEKCQFKIISNLVPLVKNFGYVSNFSIFVHFAHEENLDLLYQTFLPLLQTNIDRISAYKVIEAFDKISIEAMGDLVCCLMECRKKFTTSWKTIGAFIKAFSEEEDNSSLIEAISLFPKQMSQHSSDQIRITLKNFSKIPPSYRLEVAKKVRFLIDKYKWKGPSSVLVETVYSYISKGLDPIFELASPFLSKASTTVKGNQLLNTLIE